MSHLTISEIKRARIRESINRSALTALRHHDDLDAPFFTMEQPVQIKNQEDWTVTWPRLYPRPGKYLYCRGYVAPAWDKARICPEISCESRPACECLRPGYQQ